MRVVAVVAEERSGAAESLDRHLSAHLSREMAPDVIAVVTEIPFTRDGVVKREEIRTRLLRELNNKNSPLEDYGAETEAWCLGAQANILQRLSFQAGLKFASIESISATSASTSDSLSRRSNLRLPRRTEPSRLSRARCGTKGHQPQSAGSRLQLLAP